MSEPTSKTSEKIPTYIAAPPRLQVIGSLCGAKEALERGNHTALALADAVYSIRMAINLLDAPQTAEHMCADAAALVRVAFNSPYVETSMREEKDAGWRVTIRAMGTSGSIVLWEHYALHPVLESACADILRAAIRAARERAWDMRRGVDCIERLFDAIPTFSETSEEKGSNDAKIG